MSTPTARKAYKSDLTDAQWILVEPLVTKSRTANRAGRPVEICLREVVNTISYLNRTGGQWDMLPHDLLPKRAEASLACGCAGFVDRSRGDVCEC